MRETRQTVKIKVRESSGRDACIVCWGEGTGGVFALLQECRVPVGGCCQNPLLTIHARRKGMKSSSGMLETSSVSADL